MEIVGVDGRAYTFLLFIFIIFLFLFLFFIFLWIRAAPTGVVNIIFFVRHHFTSAKKITIKYYRENSKLNIFLN